MSSLIILPSVTPCLLSDGVGLKSGTHIIGCPVTPNDAVIDTSSGKYVEQVHLTGDVFMRYDDFVFDPFSKLVYNSL